MTREVHDIPPAPRRVRWVVVLAAGWPLGLTALVMTVYGGLIALMLFYAHDGKPYDDDALDMGPTVRTEGTVTEVVRRFESWLSGEPSERITYTFTTPGGPQTGFSFVAENRYRATDSIGVNYLPGRAETNRAQDGRLCLLGDYVSPIIGFVVLPGLLLILLWTQGAHDLRRTLNAGDVAAAQITRVEKVAWVIPVMFRARYRFRDRHAQWRDGHHWITARSVLGTRLTACSGGVSVVHDRDHPQRSRLVVPSDFGHTARPGAPLQAAPRA